MSETFSKSIDVSSLDRGLYLIAIKDIDGNLVTKKVTLK